MTFEAGPPIDVDRLRAARRFLDEIRARHAVRDAYLFGSRARGTHEPDSDADIAVVLLGDRGATIIDMAGVAFDVMRDLDIHIQAVPRWEGKFDTPKICSNASLVWNVRRGGVRLICGITSISR